jgi:hypothetical protein
LRKEGFPEPVPITKELLDSLAPKQLQILSGLGDLAKEEKRLCDKINARRPTKSGILIDQGAIMLCEDEDDWKVNTLAFRHQLIEVRGKIKQILEQALDSGLAHLGLIQRQCANYGVKL